MDISSNNTFQIVSKAQMLKKENDNNNNIKFNENNFTSREI